MRREMERFPKKLLGTKDYSDFKCSLSHFISDIFPMNLTNAWFIP